jgi:hypothetical protein
MAFTVSTRSAKDGDGVLLPGGLRAFDITGAAAGPWILGHILVDGIAGVERAKVLAASTAAAAADPALVVAISPNGEVAHDAVDSGNGSKIAAKAIAHGTNPTAVAAADRTDLYANRHGILFVQPGHPNVISREHVIADSDGAQTDAALLTVGAGAKIVITQISCKADASNTTNVAVRIGFGTATLAAASLTGTNGILLSGQFAASGGHQEGTGAGIIGIGADNEDLRITCGDPVSGNLRVTYSYYTIES